MSYIIRNNTSKFEFSCSDTEPNFIVSKSKDWIENTILNEGVWDIENIELGKKLIIPNTTVLDIGANMGTWTICLAKLFKECEFTAFEPQKNKYHQLCANVFINNISNVTTFRYALTDNLNNKNLLFYIASEGNNGASRLEEEYLLTKCQTTISHTEMVPASMLDTFDFNSNVSLIKLDVEGHELNVLTGGKNLIEKCKPSIIFESWDHCTHKKPELFKFLSEHGYNIFRLKHSEYLAVHSSNVANKDFLNQMQKIL